MGILNKLSGIIDNASEHGERVDFMLEVVHWFMTLLFIGWAAFLTYVIIRFRRKRNPKAIYHGVQSTASSHLEIGVIITEIILLLGFAFPLWAQRVDQFPDPDIRVNAVAEQFSWNFHYPGPDGRFGITNRFLIDGSNPIGLDPNDPNGRDDFISPKLVIPKDARVEIAVTSKDVIHNLALPAMRIAQDADPGKISRMWFVPVRTGESEIICGQLCGVSHGVMRAILEVVPDMKRFDAWAKERNPVFGSSAQPADAEPAAGTPAGADAVPPPQPEALPAPAGNVPAPGQ